MNSKRYLTRRALPKRNALVVALALGMGISGLAYGQATTGSIFGTAPAGDSVKVVSNSGLTRTVMVSSDGSYSVGHLPVGSYTVTLLENGNSVSSRNNVNVSVGGGTSVPFANQENAQQLGAVQVVASALPAIDVSTVQDSTTITAQQLRKLPVGRDMTSIALLTPGTMDSTAFGGITFGGSSVTENAYYVNGYNTGDPYRNLYGFQLPYGAIAQQQTMAGGFDAKYGRSDGGVINQIGKSGTNEWHFGGQIVWEPEHLQASPRSQYYGPVPIFTVDGNGDPMSPAAQRDPGALGPVGSMWNYNGDDKSWLTTYTAYVGGPLVKDKLFIFLDGEYTETAGQSICSISCGQYTTSASHQTKFYGKINWNIDENNILELTMLSNKNGSGQGASYLYDYGTNTTGPRVSVNNITHNDSKFLIGKYTGYLTDNLTLQVTYGKGEFRPVTDYAVPFDNPYISGATSQDPAAWARYTAATGIPVDPDVGLTSHQPNGTVTSPQSHLDTHGLRVDLSYVAGDHTLMVGIDNMRYGAEAQGVEMTGTEYPAETAAALKQGAALSGVPASYDPTANGGEWIYISGTNLAVWEQYITSGGMSVKQNAYYLEDKWQVTPNLLLNIGVRNDNYSNYTGDGQKFVDEKNQWEPRIGASWDVFGDSSLKIYGNVGRYYLALPNNAANRAADRSTLVYGYLYYSDINKDGIPVGTLTPLGGMYSPDGEYGTKKDVKLVSSQDLKPMYMDQINLGFDAKVDFLNTSWTYGAKLSYRELQASIDDECSPDRIQAKMMANDASLTDADFASGGKYFNSLYVNGYCRLFNPGGSNTMLIKNDITGDYDSVKMTFKDWGFSRKPVRKNASVNLYFEHPFDGKWQARVDYTYTHARGNTVGQVRPDIAQADVSKTEDWDNPALMVGAYGELPNTREQVLRFRGTYQLTPEWAVSAIARIQSGEPQDCLGYYGPNASEDPAGYNGKTASSYHWCAGHIMRSGSDSPLTGHTPWLHTYDLSVNWAPAFADHKMNLQLTVFNVFNEQKAATTASSAYSSYLYGSKRYVNPLFHMPVYEAPRSVRLSISYDY